MSTVTEHMDPAVTHATGTLSRVTWLQMMTDIHPRHGGLSAAIPELSRALHAFGVDAPVAALCGADEQFVPWQVASDAMHFLPRSRRTWALQTTPHAHLESLVRNCDGLHVHGLWTPATQAGSRASRRTGKPLCLTAHGMLEPWSLKQHRLRKQMYGALVEHRILRGAACLHALTRSEAESYHAIAKAVPVVVVPNGVDVPADVSAQHFFAAYPKLRERRIVLFLSRLHPKKAVDLLLRAWPQLQERHPDAHLVIAGTGEASYEAKLKGWAAQHLSQESVTFTGLLQGRMKWGALRAAECFVLPSHSEGLSVAILEALGAGTPVIATAYCNMPELETDRCGWLTLPNEAALQATLDHVLGQAEATNRQFGQRGRALIQQRYTWSVVGRQMADVYRWLGGAAMPVETEVLQ